MSETNQQGMKTAAKWFFPSLAEGLQFLLHNQLERRFTRRYAAYSGFLFALWFEK